MPTVDQNTLLQTVFGKFVGETHLLYRDIATAIQKNLKKGLSVNDAVNKAFRDIGYESEMMSLYDKGMGTVSPGAVKGTVVSIAPEKASKYFLFTEFDGATLSDRVHSKEAQRIVKDSLNTFFTKKSSVETLFKSLKEGGFDKVSDPKLPKKIQNAILEFRKTGIVDKKLEDAIRRARIDVDKLSGIEKSSDRLKRSYDNVLNALEKGDERLLNKSIDIALNSKVDSYNKAIARTEFARAYEMSFQRAMHEDDDIWGFEVVLSSRHEIADICDCYAEADMYGAGEGLAPKDAGINIPFHTNCLCGKLFIRFGDPRIKGNERFSGARVNDYLYNIDEEKRNSIIGKKYSSNRDKYQTGLERRGFQITKKPAMVPQSIITIEE